MDACQALLLRAHDSDACDELLRWTAALPVAVKNHLRGEAGAEGELVGVLAPDSIRRWSLLNM